MASLPPLPPPPHGNPPNKYRGTWQDISYEELEKARTRRARVLAHPDIAARLCDPPMRYPSPELWTGYIPPAQVPHGSHWKPNNSPIRRQLIDIVRAVADREREQEAG